MKRWTIKELSETTDLKFAACILRERRAPLNPYSPLAQKLEDSKNMLLRMDGYLTGGEAEPRSRRRRSSRFCTGTGITRRLD